MFDKQLNLALRAIQPEIEKLWTEGIKKLERDYDCRFIPGVGFVGGPKCE